MTGNLIKADLSQSTYGNDMARNRWYPDIAMVATVKPGQEAMGPSQVLGWSGRDRLLWVEATLLGEVDGRSRRVALTGRSCAAATT